MDEAETTIRKSMQNRKGVETFVASARISMYNKIFGLNPSGAYRSPTLPPAESADGAIDLAAFNKKEKP